MYFRRNYSLNLIEGLSAQLISGNFWRSCYHFCLGLEVLNLWHTNSRVNEKKNVFFFSSLLFILKNLFIEKIFKWLPKIVYWLLADFKRKKYLGNTIKKTLDNI